MLNHFDCLVIGGGPGGSTAALLLARAGWSVALLESKPFPRRKVCGEYLSGTNLPLLDRLGIGDAFREQAGPEIHKVGLFAGTATLVADLPRPNSPNSGWGRALGRELLDTLLLEQARRAGVEVLQPWTAVALERRSDGYCCRARQPGGPGAREMTAHVVIAAHGSWQSGALPTQVRRQPPCRSDLFGFKTHFANCDLPADVMPLLTFPGGYGGMVHADGGRVSLSCCVRRECLVQLRAQGPSADAGEVVLEHIRESCRGARRVLAGAVRVDPWLAAGPIRPGIRLGSAAGIYRVGNCAGEAHPVIAEGIGMALQAAWLLANQLRSLRRASGAALAQATRAYRWAWRRAFAPRLYTAAVVAHWAMRPAAVGGIVPLLHCFPAVLSWGARLSGKATRLVGS
jgi:flavin-dependent dehydrogenase